MGQSRPTWTTPNQDASLNSRAFCTASALSWQRQQRSCTKCVVIFRAQRFQSPVIEELKLKVRNLSKTPPPSTHNLPEAKGSRHARKVPVSVVLLTPSISNLHHDLWRPVLLGWRPSLVSSFMFFLKVLILSSSIRGAANKGPPPKTPALRASSPVKGRPSAQMRPS